MQHGAAGPLPVWLSNALQHIFIADFRKAAKAFTSYMHVMPDCACEKGAPHLPYPCYTMTCGRVLVERVVQDSLPDISYVTTFSDT